MPLQPGTTNRETIEEINENEIQTRTQQCGFVSSHVSSSTPFTKVYFAISSLTLKRHPSPIRYAKHVSQPHDFDYDGGMKMHERKISILSMDKDTRYPVAPAPA